MNDVTTHATREIRAPRLDIRQLRIRLVGDTPLISHAWSAKAREMILAKQMKQARGGKQPKDLERDFVESLYPHPAGGYGFPAVAFKSAAVDACSHVEGITKVEARGAFHILEEIVPIEGVPTARSDMVRVGMGVADVRCRGEFKQWSTEFSLRYNLAVLSANQIENLFSTAGFAIGVGDWRPQRDGSFGMFHVEKVTAA